MAPIYLALIYFVVFTAVGGNQTAGERTSKWPRLFHLDDYDQCLSRRDGLYCLGTFHLKTDRLNSLYDVVKELSGPNNFNRTLVHRGYCVSSRCPSSESNMTLHFERCVQEKARTSSLTSTLHRLNYCRFRGQRTESGIAWTHHLFLAVVCALVLMNIIGTSYDLLRASDKDTILNCWSLKVNWNKFITSYEGEDSSRKLLTSIQGARVLLLVLVVLSHAVEITYKLHIVNPDFLETAQHHPMAMLIRNGSSIVQTFTVISNFLSAFILLRYAQKRNLGISMLPMCILHRIIRISPVYLLVIGFSATWWRYAGDGPLWYDLVNAESDICRRKFWSHIFFLNNLVEPQSQCMLQTWFLAVDMQLYIVGCFVTLLLAKNLRRAIFVLSGLVVASCLLNVCLAYIYNWKPLLYILSPENLRTTFRGVPSFWYFYISPWGSLPACLLGLLAAHVQYYMQKEGYDITKTKWLVRIYNISVPLCVAWVLTGYAMTTVTTRASIAAYIGFERPMFSAIIALLLYGSTNNLSNCFDRFFSWKGWHIPARLSLSVLVLHRLINLQFVATRTSVIYISFSTILYDGVVTAIISYLLAIPLTLLVEIPVQRTFTATFTIR